MPDATQQRVLVTGASGAIGEAVCRRLAQDGARLAITWYSRRPDDLISELSPEVAQSCDLSSREAVDSLVEQASATLGGLTTVVHAAGPHVPMVYLSRIDDADFSKQIEVDVVGTFHVAQAVLKHLRESSGTLTFVTTAATTRYPTRDSLSAVPKGAVEALARAIAVEEGRFGVRVNCVGPGMLHDGMSARLQASGDLDERALAAATNNIPLRRFGHATDIAEAVAFLASDAAGFITGQKLDVDGGYGV